MGSPYFQCLYCEDLMTHLVCRECVNAVWRVGGRQHRKERDQNCVLTSAPQSLPLVFPPASVPFQDGLLPSDSMRGIWGSPSGMFLLILPFVFPAQSLCHLSTKASYLFVALIQVPGTLCGHLQCFACGVASWEVATCLT